MYSIALQGYADVIDGHSFRSSARQVPDVIMFLKTENDIPH